MTSFVVPGTCLTVTDGSIVMLADFPGKKWVAHYGWYQYDGQQMMGWYCCSIPENEVQPMDMDGLVVVSEGSNCVCPPPAPPIPRPPIPRPPIPPIPPCADCDCLTEEQARGLFASRDDVNAALELASSANSTAQEAKQQVAELNNNIDGVIAQKVESIVSSDMVEPIVIEVLAEQLPPAVSKEVAIQLEDGGWGTLT